jgi:hypothetical protein
MDGASPTIISKCDDHRRLYEKIFTVTLIFGPVVIFLNQFIGCRDCVPSQNR